jgi:hypothetical protein
VGGDTQRQLTIDEQRLFESVQAGSTDALVRGAATLEVRWVEHEGTAGLWPEFLLSSTGNEAPPLAWWYWPDERWYGSMAIAGFGLGGSDVGCVGFHRGNSIEQPSENVESLTDALVHGRVALAAYRAELEEYEPPAPDGAVTVWVHYRVRSGVAAVRAYLEEPDAFKRATGISLTGDVGIEHPVPPYAPELFEGGAGTGVQSGPGWVSASVRVGRP